MKKRIQKTNISQDTLRLIFSVFLLSLLLIVSSLLDAKHVESVKNTSMKSEQIQPVKK
ncbi:hypothetical protein GMA11_05700 [Granulicatella sp. zg-ZJ]|uniref:hypothetical protein n=1 Tax=unclassified Granulicatella TaxID=2630493 RepID=UPI0013C07056|nr:MULTISPECIES: hypothetical protein [unclassified Granulicatella]MBS4750604.1 hypothetical protein [Carnobacteriaceae bacterium zg-ZUI78]NEW62883.1 hypothetical protein [Granulicatella sp. zg-ZJ]NEW66328.1 hypothetical protein [Granulicatella sp. zg-84]QMI85393.1 hypothetical protein H1220_06645 [Carnobacteriaceae bacterium zg-84]